MSTFKGRSEDCRAPFLGAEFWKKGTNVKGRVVRMFKTANGPSYALRLFKPVSLNGDSCEEVSIGGLRGVEMAVQQAGAGSLLVGDAIYLECTGSTASQKGHARLDFEVEISRPDSASSEITDDDVPL